MPTHRNPSIPNVPLIERNMILLKKSAHLVLKTPPAVVRRLLVDVTDQWAKICRPDRKQTIPALPRETGHPLLLHPHGRPRFNLRYEFRGRFSSLPASQQDERDQRPHPTRKHSQSNLRAAPARYAWSSPLTSSLISGAPLFCAEDDMDQVETQRLGAWQGLYAGPSALLDIG